MGEVRQSLAGLQVIEWVLVLSPFLHTIAYPSSPETIFYNEPLAGELKMVEQIDHPLAMQVPQLGG